MFIGRSYRQIATQPAAAKRIELAVHAPLMGAARPP